MPAITQSQLRLDLQRTIRALEKYYFKQPLHLDGTVVRSADLIKGLREQLRLLDEADARRAEWLRVVHLQRAKEATNASMTRHLKTFVRSCFGEGSPAFLEFGFLPRKIAKKSTATKANAVMKSRATRASRRTPLPVPAPVAVAVPAPVPAPAPLPVPAPVPVAAPVPAPAPHPSPSPHRSPRPFLHPSVARHIAAARSSFRDPSPLD